MVMSAIHPCPRHPLLLGQHGQQPKDDRYARVQLHAHETMRDRIGDIFEMHGLTFDEYSDCDDRIERL